MEIAKEVSNHIFNELAGEGGKRIEDLARAINASRFDGDLLSVTRDFIQAAKKGDIFGLDIKHVQTHRSFQALENTMQRWIESMKRGEV